MSTDVDSTGDSAESAEPKSSEAAAPATISAQVEDAGPCKKKVSIEVAAERVTDEYEKSYRQINKTVPFPGFRPGRVPRGLLEKQFGEEVEKEVKGTLVSDAFDEAMKSNDLKPIDEPDFDIDAIEVKEGEPLTFDLTVEVRPEFELADWSGLEVKGEPVEVTDDDVDAAIKELLASRATVVPVEGKVEENDFVVYDATIRVGDDVVYERENLSYFGGSAHLAELHVEEAAAKIVGAEADQEITFDLKLPESEDDWGEHAGGDATLTVTIREIKRHQIPELDDELAKGFDYDDAAELRGDIEERVRAGKERQAQDVVDDRIVDALIEANPFELPEGVVSKEQARSVVRQTIDMQRHGASESEIAEKIAELKAQAGDRVRKEFARTLILEAIADKERVFVTESEVRDEITSIGAGYGRSYEEMLDYFEQQDSLSTLRARLREAKTLDRIRKKTTIVDK